MITVIPEFAEGEYPGPRAKDRALSLATLGAGSRAIAFGRHDKVVPRAGGAICCRDYRNSEDKENDDALTIGGDFSATRG